MENENNKKVFGKRLQQQRKKMGYKSQLEFGCAMGVHIKSVQNWEQGLAIPENHNIIKICELLHCDMDYLFGYIDQSTHEIQEIHEITGLSENAIQRLKYWKDTGSFYSQEMVNRLSKLICNRNFFDLIHKISDFLWRRSNETGTLSTPTSGHFLKEEEMRSIKLLNIIELLNKMRTDVIDQAEKGTPDRIPSEKELELKPISDFITKSNQ